MKIVEEEADPADTFEVGAMWAHAEEAQDRARGEWDLDTVGATVGPVEDLGGAPWAERLPEEEDHGNRHASHTDLVVVVEG